MFSVARTFGFLIKRIISTMICITDAIFLSLSLFIVLSSLFIIFEKYAPAVFLQLMKYGSVSNNGSNEAGYVRFIEMPKAYFKHFYVNASVLSVFTFIYMVRVYFGGLDVNYAVVFMVKALMGQKKPISGLAALLTMLLLTVQCVKRMYETFFLQVFAKTSRMNAIHYFMGIAHYTFVVVAILGHAPLFNGDKTRDFIWTDSSTTILSVPCALTFFWATIEQYRSNVILANLRQDKKSGAVVNEDYAIPRGRWFEVVSSPHRMFELVIYAALFALQRTDTWFYVVFWVVTNQVCVGYQAHSWYKKEFKSYPNNRKVIIPYLF